jgi:hypothetical protein
MGPLMIVAGVLLGTWAYLNYRVPEFEKAVIFQGSLGNLIHMACAAAAFVLIVWGAVALIS